MRVLWGRARVVRCSCEGVVCVGQVGGLVGGGGGGGGGEMLLEGAGGGRALGRVRDATLEITLCRLKKLKVRS